MVYPEYRFQLAPAVDEGEADDRPINPGGSKLGGRPNWIQYDEVPACPACGEPMDFVAQIDSIGRINQRADLLGSGAYVFSDGGMIYVFFCGNCNEVDAVLQFH